MEQLCEYLKFFNLNVIVEANPFCGCLHPNLKLDFSNMCPADWKRWFKVVKCKMISNASRDMTAKDVGLLAAGLTMINSKEFFNKMKDQMTGEEIENLLLDLIKNFEDNCSFGKKDN